jgi:hypothetical protein
MISYWMDFGFSFIDSEVSWRFPIAFQILFALIILLFILELPESPRYSNSLLFMVSQTADNIPDGSFSRVTKTRLWKFLRHCQIHLLKTNVFCPSSQQLRIPCSKRKAQLLRIFSLWMKTAIFIVSHLLISIKCSNRFLESISVSFPIIFQLEVLKNHAHLFTVTYYAATIYENEIGLSPFISRILAACNGTEYFLASWISVFIIEKVGRRKLMLFGAAGMSGSMVVLAVMTKIGGTGPGIVAAAFLFIFNTFFAIGWLGEFHKVLSDSLRLSNPLFLGMTWLYPAEIVPLRIRAKANALSTSANWAFNFMVVMITPVSFSSIGYKTYIIFAVINAFIFPVVYFFYPETAYRSLEEMDTIFQKTKNIFTVVWTAKHEPRRYGKNGEVLIEYEQTGEHERRVSNAERRGSVLSQINSRDYDGEKGGRQLHEGYRGNPGGPAPMGGI